MKKSRGSLINLPREGVSSNLNRWSANGRLVFIGNDTVKKPDSSSPGPAGGSSMAGDSSMAGGGEPPHRDYQSSPRLVQTVEKLRANSSRHLKLATIDHTWRAATRERRRHCRCTRAHQIRKFKTSQPQRKAREERGGDSELTKAKKRTRTLPQAPPTNRPQEPRVPASYAQSHVMKLEF
jgi:hypothetical protein